MSKLMNLQLFAAGQRLQKSMFQDVTCIRVKDKVYGNITFLPNHVPCLISMPDAKVYLKFQDEHELVVNVSKGYLSIPFNNQVKIISEKLNYD